MGKTSELWAFVDLGSGENISIDNGYLERTNNLNLPVKGQTPWQSYLRGNYCLVLKMNSETPVKNVFYHTYLQILAKGSEGSYYPAKTDRKITESGERVLENPDTPLPIALFLSFVNDGCPTEIIRRTEQLENFDDIDRVCRQRRYVKRVKPNGI